MNRIEEIKERIKSDVYNNAYVDSDVLVLLDRLETAEKALEGITTYANTEMQSPEDLGYTYQDIAEKALQQIRV